MNIAEKDLFILIQQVIVHIKSQNKPSRAIDHMVAKAEFLKNLVEKKECTSLVQLMSYVFYISEVELNSRGGLN